MVSATVPHYHIIPRKGEEVFTYARAREAKRQRRALLDGGYRSQMIECVDTYCSYLYDVLDRTVVAEPHIQERVSAGISGAYANGAG